MSVVDDFGRYYADPGMLRAACYPRQLSKVSDSDIGKWLACAQKAGLVRVYLAANEAADRKGSSCGDKPAGGSGLPTERYVQMLDFRQQERSKSKFPGPPSEQSPSTSDADAAQMHSRCIADGEQLNTVFVFEDVGVCETRAGAERVSAPEKPKPKSLGTTLPSDWRPREKDVQKLAAEFHLATSVVGVQYADAFRDSCAAKGYVYRDFDAAFRNCVRQDWPHLRNGAKTGPVTAKPDWDAMQ